MLKSLLTRSHFFRTLVPKWSFFENSGHTPLLLVRQVSHQTPESLPWQNILPYQKRSFLNLVFNPKTNLYHSYMGILNQCLLEIATLPQDNLKLYEQTSSYHLMLQLILNQIPKLYNPLPQNFDFQFKLVVESIDKNLNIHQSDLIISRILSFER